MSSGRSRRSKCIRCARAVSEWARRTKADGGEQAEDSSPRFAIAARALSFPEPWAWEESRLRRAGGGEQAEESRRAGGGEQAEESRRRRAGGGEQAEESRRRRAGGGEQAKESRRKGRCESM